MNNIIPVSLNKVVGVIIIIILITIIQLQAVFAGLSHRLLPMIPDAS